MKRKIITIHEELCNGCGICVDACHEGAIELVDGVAKLVSDSYCDGFGDCLPECPTGAIEMIEREAADYDEVAVNKRIAERQAAAGIGREHGGSAARGHGAGEFHGHGNSGPGYSHGHGQGGGHGHHHGHGGCPGSMAQLFRREETAAGPSAAPAKASVPAASSPEAFERPSELNQWPIQIHLVNPANPYFDGANLLIAADCTAFAYGDFHKDFIKNHITLIGCPKLDDNAYYAEKLTDILRQHDIRSITVVRMVVPCCGGIVQAVKQAMLASQTIVPYREVTISLEGEWI
ncbi:ATP-binding protein [Gorillibacterium timonense]|uniref:ATP-binding protein n=1 Tax=Gorillibacterium timonense TaxID=1689269 RepID=UPI00071CC012|nr:4Fe-4S dicluster domain-containing protein [Gorillibacterium timonense]